MTKATCHLRLRRNEIAARKPNILIIDDEISICESLQGALENEGHTVPTALSGEEGFRLLAGEHINLVFLDILMPGGMGGIETLRRMKQMLPDTEAQAHGTVGDKRQMSPERRLCCG